MKERLSVQNICEGGSGSEARITVELRTEFSGIGGIIITNQALVTALREEFNPSSKAGHLLFLRHIIIKKLDDFFHRKGIYSFAHIPRPLGSISRLGPTPFEAYLYEWVFGKEGFPWQCQNSDDGNFLSMILDEWNQFVEAFGEAGIDLAMDCADADDGRVSKNIIHQLYYYDVVQPALNCLWQRIDLGNRSIGVDCERLAKFLKDEAEALRSFLGSERYEMMNLAFCFLREKEKMNPLNIGRLEIYVKNYRVSTLRHLISRNQTMQEFSGLNIDSGAESLL